MLLRKTTQLLVDYYCAQQQQHSFSSISSFEYTWNNMLKKAKQCLAIYNLRIGDTILNNLLLTQIQTSTFLFRSHDNSSSQNRINKFRDPHKRNGGDTIIQLMEAIKLKVWLPNFDCYFESIPTKL
uniref:Uncharacterized protein n=1 Tax=Glossina brevipalpis TaxID=37001 RepID=A0A1A9W8K9_9MUSC